ncbi:GNAT family N-acetyltransferase [Kitasatospora sp. CB02891]|uniref:GNAT family N-acetyltransferase n=1 Tax=Kitasatospora sp. CB02891 TaxID=2020329 RepID=UPI000C276176|nr:GNAT family N-acetyltransferase [Kitasatospora sp. CB02891]PJN21106.1 N-acetyltransferase [Kitasatospora sp. CB02891]
MSGIFPETVMQTSRLTLRPFTGGDIDDTRAACSDELTQRWLPLPRPYTREDATAWCTEVAHALRESGDGIHFAIADASNDRLMGTVGLKKTDWRARVSEVGYWVAPWARGRGIAAEATRVLGEWLLTDRAFQRMELLAATENTASQKVALRAGLHREGVLRNAGFVHAGRVDLVLFSLVPQDFQSRPPAPTDPSS